MFAGRLERTTSEAPSGVNCAAETKTSAADGIFQAGLADIGDDADYGGVFVADILREAADGTLAGPVQARGGFVNDDDARVGGRILPSEIAAFDQVHAHGLDVAGSDYANEGVCVVVLAVNGTFGDETPTTIAIERKHV